MYANRAILVFLGNGRFVLSDATQNVVTGKNIELGLKVNLSKCFEAMEKMVHVRTFGAGGIDFFRLGEHYGSSGVLLGSVSIIVWSVCSKGVYHGYSMD